MPRPEGLSWSFMAWPQALWLGPKVSVLRVSCVKKLAEFDLARVGILFWRVSSSWLRERG
jgi:hypothetical protein